MDLKPNTALGKHDGAMTGLVIFIQNADYVNIQHMYQNSIRLISKQTNT